MTEAMTLALNVGILIGTCVWNIATIRGATKSLREAVDDMKAEFTQHRRDLRAAEKRLARIEGRIDSHHWHSDHGEHEDREDDNG